MNKIREILKSEMDKRRLSANKLADLTLIPQPTISRILNGKTLDPETDTVKALADYFKLTVAEMRGEVEPLQTSKHVANEARAFYKSAPEDVMIDYYRELNEHQKKLILEIVKEMIK